MAHQLTVQLLGVCVHLGQESGVSLPAGVLHRVVYPAGRAPFIDGVEAHSPTVEILSGPTVVWPQTSIANCIVTFSNDATTSGVSGLLGCVPSMRQFFPELTLDLDKVTGHPADDFAFVDFNAGVISPMQVDGAADSQVILEFPGPTISVTLTHADGTTRVRNEIALPATVVFDSHAREHQELDYFITLRVTNLPSTEPPGLRHQVHNVIEFVKQCVGWEGDAGCSNSQFP